MDEGLVEEGGRLLRLGVNYWCNIRTLHTGRGDDLFKIPVLFGVFVLYSFRFRSSSSGVGVTVVYEVWDGTCRDLCQ